MNENQTINIYVDYRLAIQLFGQKFGVKYPEVAKNVVFLF